jgi:hypothetical protein
MARPGEKPSPKLSADDAEELERLKKENKGSNPALPFNDVAVARIGKLIAQSASKPRKPKERR